MNNVETLFLKLSYVVTVFFFFASIALFISLLVIKSRVWKHFKRRD
ncbi:hypothetical protein [Vagococcus fluvialis]|uniref:Uncharacterized protein n=1 Tax=Vagococcus fluvialis TaxID=2738 RepID=A0A7X6I2N6_9ENTE|nr:hypothetical protein [Vagococcus fluvialis]NKC67029.1 hypothetical protein [Vagococcus fluvialis]